MDTLNHVTLNGVTKYVKDSAGQAMLAPEELTLTAANAYAVGDLFRYDGKLYKASAAIAIGDTIEVGANCEETTIAGENIKDVQVNGVSVLQDGVANVPVASNSSFGVTKGNINQGVGVDSVSKNLYVSQASDSQVKAGISVYKPITPANQHIATFYGLAKAAGSDEKNSTLPVGQYTESAKSAIQTMLGVEQGVSFVESVSGTAVTINGIANTRYMCGEVTTITITPPSIGTIDVLFKSGSTVAVLTVPNTVKWPVWFDATALDTDTTYELVITDGVYGGVMAWPD